MMTDKLPVNDVQSGLSPAKPRGSLLLVTAVRLRNGKNGLQIDDQTAAGIGRWAESFDQVTFAGILLDSHVDEDTSTTWVDVRSLPFFEQVRFVPLPMAYRFGAFARAYRRVRKLLGEEISRADHLCFTLGYVVGDWAAVAALGALKQKRKYGVWFDRVEHDVLRRTIQGLPLKRRLKEHAMLLVMEPYHRFLAERSTLALLQGMDTFNAYKRSARNPVCVYDVHTTTADFAPDDAVARKRSDIENGAPLKIVYVGRAVDMKGPLDWLEAIAFAIRSGVPLQATWLGDGPRLAEMRDRAHALNIEGHVTFAGHVGERAQILNAMRQAHFLLFCHKTPESPRCLIEALVSGCPIVGYDSDYARKLVEEGGGGVSPLNRPDLLAGQIEMLHRDRDRLSNMVLEAALAGRQYDEAGLYRERADLIKSYA